MLDNYFTFIANTRNKQLLFDGIDELEARYVASYSKALDFAFNELQNFNNRTDEVGGSEDGANCHKLIMIFR